ncbi:hypothetical protein MKW94_000783 [Papaver nudicaule]|uniref:Pentatricopeptide repeat-containing protein n=1 Tax=Papaver nudicaule TaxID=74823 RepID=A0AA41S4F6_PAPNU|nr:hypothetical protein [Papaver nudicaule]
MVKIPPLLRPSNLLRRNYVTKTHHPLPTQQLTSTPPPPPPSLQPYFPPSDKKTKKNSLQPSRTKPLTPPKDTKPIFTSRNLTDAQKTFDYILSTSPFPLDTRHYNSLLESYTQICTLDDSISFVKYMQTKQPSFSPDRLTYNVLFCQSLKYLLTPEWEADYVRKITDFMVTDGFSLNHGAFDLFVRSVCSIGREERAVELVKELSVRCSPPSYSTYNFLVRHLCKSMELGSVYEFIDEMRDSMRPDLATYTILIDFVCKSKNLREARKLFGVLGAAGFKPDAFLYNTIMKGYCMLNMGSDVIGVYKEMMEKGVKPDIVTYNTMIFGLSKVGRLEEARKYLGVMVEMGHNPETVTYTTLMNGMCRKGDAIGAVGLLGEMEGMGCEPDSCTYNTLLHGLCKKRLLDKGMELYEVMKSKEIKLEPASYATFVRMLCREDKIAGAYEVYDYAVKSKSLTDVAAYEALENELKWLKKAKAKAQGIA